MIQPAKDFPSDLPAKFGRDGFVAIDQLFDKETMDEINKEASRYIRDIVPSMPETEIYFEDKNNRSTIKQIQKMFFYDAYFAELIESGPINKLAELLLGEDVVPVNLQYFNKPPGIGKATPAHQDGYYFHLKPCRAVTGWLALEEVDEENGCIHYVKGSHKEPEFRPHGQTGVLGFSQGISDFGTEDDRARTAFFPGSAGTFLMHHAKTIHWAGANRSATRSRRALGFIYYAKSAKPDSAAHAAYQAELDKRLKATGKI